MNFAFIILAMLDIMAELTQLSYELGAAARKYLVPVAVASYVIAEMAWESVTTYNFTIKWRRTPMTTGFAYC